MSKKKQSLVLAVAACMPITSVNAGLIYSPISAWASSTALAEQNSDYSIDNTIDQSGLNSGYLSGVTDFDSYMASGPMHQYMAQDTEWFSASGDITSSVVYDMGSVFELYHLALWNEEYSGFGQADIFWSLDNVTYSSLTVINPFDSKVALDYSAQIFDLGVTAQFLKFELSGCAQPDGGPGDYCGIGEVAFDASRVYEVPEPGTLALIALGLTGLGLRLRRAA